MTNISWWRSWHGAPIDHKWAVIASRADVKVGIVSAIVWALLDYASQHDNRGSVDGFDVETYSVYSGFPEDEINAVMQALYDKCVLKDGRFVNWEKRQPKREDETSNERVRKYRELKRNVTQCNAPEKEEDIDIDKDKDKDKREENPSSPFETIQYTIERITGIPPAGEAGIKAINDLITAGVTEDDIRKGYEWLSSNGMTFRYYSQIVGPSKTARAQRMKTTHAPPKSKRVLVGPDNETVEVEA